MPRTKSPRAQKVTNEKVLRLKKLSEDFELSPFSLAPIVDASAQQIYCWFRGDVPTARSLERIEEAIRKIEKSFEEGAVWSGPDDPNDPAILAEKKTALELRRIFGRLMAVAMDTERRVLSQAWPEFSEVVKALRRYEISYRI